MNKVETELIYSEIEHDWSYLKPIKYVPMWRVALEMIAFAALVSVFVYGLLWLASVGAL